MNNNWIVKAIQQWKTEGVALNEGIAIEAISNAEKTVDFIFPDEFKALYTTSNGFVDFEWLPNMFSVWSLERILVEYNDAQHKDHFGFADYLINSHQIGFVKNRIGVFVLHEENPKKIADTFSEAIYLINTDSEKIY